MSGHTAADRPDHVVVVGASLAGLRAVQEARALGHSGPLTLVGDERHLPYDRPPLSKEFLDRGSDTTTHRLVDSAELARLDVTVHLGQRATGLDVGHRAVRVGDEELPYDALLVTTGVRPRALPGQERLDGVHVLRSVEDSVAIHAALERRPRTVVVGAGFIGAEIASAAADRGLSPVIIEAAASPLGRAVGPLAGRRLNSLHARHGVEVRLGVGVAEFLGHERVEGVRLSDGTELPADLVVVGVGAVPNTEWLEGSGLTLADGVVCDAHLQAAPAVWAAGDVARWHNPLFDRAMRLEHWTNAGEQGAHAMTNLLDPAAATPYAPVPYFWSDWYGHRIQFAGIAVGDPVLVSGSWEGDSFVALYRDGDRVAGVLTLDRRGDIMKHRALIARAAAWQSALELAERRNAVTLAGTPS